MMNFLNKQLIVDLFSAQCMLEFIGLWVLQAWAIAKLLAKRRVELIWPHFLKYNYLVIRPSSAFCRKPRGNSGAMRGPLTKHNALGFYGCKGDANIGFRCVKAIMQIGVCL